MEREWTSSDLSEYITRFHDNQREAVLRTVLEGELLKKFLSTTEGRLILNNVVDSIRDNTSKVVSLCISDFDANYDVIKQTALKIGVAHDFMRAIASLAINGEEHKEQMKKGRRKVA
jgi:hypothetical protein